jgi:hypothetical protein
LYSATIIDVCFQVDKILGNETIIQKLMQAGELQDNLQLRHDEYSVVHRGAKYGKYVDRHPKLRQLSPIQEIASNGVKGAIQRQPGDPIYFASDIMTKLRCNLTDRYIQQISLNDLSWRRNCSSAPVRYRYWYLQYHNNEPNVNRLLSTERFGGLVFGREWQLHCLWTWWLLAGSPSC